MSEALGNYESLADIKVDLENLVVEAETIRDNKEATAEEVSGAVEGLKNKIVEAKEEIKAFENVSKIELEEAINKAEALNKKDYTEDSYKSVLTTIEEGKKLLNSKDATQADIDAAVARINNAIKNLVKIDNGNSGNNNGSNNGNENNGNGNNNGNSGKGENELPQTGGVAPILPLILGGVTAAVGGLLVKKKRK